MKLNATFKGVADKLAIDFERLAKEIDHHGQAGEARELALRGLLAQYLPKRAAVDTGFVIDSAGRQSAQMDIVVYDRAYAIELDVAGKHYYPCETVIAVGEVKAAITSTARLREALANIASAKVLERSAQHPITGPGYSTREIGRPFDPSANHRDQVFGFIFTGASLQETKLMSELQRWQSEHPRRVWPNVYCDFRTTIVSYFDSSLPTSAMDARGMYCTVPDERQNLLLLLFAQLASFVNEAHVARPPIFKYAGISETFGADYPLGDETDGEPVSKTSS